MEHLIVSEKQLIPLSLGGDKLHKKGIIFVEVICLFNIKKALITIIFN